MILLRGGYLVKMVPFGRKSIGVRYLHFTGGSHQIPSIGAAASLASHRGIPMAARY